VHGKDCYGFLVPPQLIPIQSSAIAWTASEAPLRLLCCTLAL